MSQQALRGDTDFSDGLTRIGDSPVEEWFTDHTRVMQTRDWYGYEHWGPTYGNFWALRVCNVFPHRWRELPTPLPEPGFAFSGSRIIGSRIRRCERCGSQVYASFDPPKRGRY